MATTSARIAEQNVQNGLRTTSESFSALDAVPYTGTWAPTYPKSNT